MARDRIGFVGYGRFGKAMGDLFAEAGHGIVAWDPNVVPEPGRSATSLADLAARADVVVLAVPIPAIREAVAALRPHVSARHFVIDVGSVKVNPMAAMEAILGTAVPWTGTHPLFGPTSLALGERPLRTVVCPNPVHPGAAARARGLFENAGCVVIEEPPDEHDRVMADCHALTYFVAKGLIDAGARFDAEFSPPSAAGIARTLQSVRSDAGHLYQSMHRENPFAAEARRRLLEALERADAALREDVRTAAGAPPAAALAIPDLGARSPQLRAVRDLIDEVDRDLVRLLTRRALLARRAAHAKAEIGAEVRDPRREGELRAERRAWAVATGLDPEAVDGVFEAVLRFSRKLQGGDPS